MLAPTKVNRCFDRSRHCLLFFKLIKYSFLVLLLCATLPALSTTYTSTGVGTWDANGAPPNPLPSGDIVNVGHAGMLFDWPNTVTLQSGSTLNINSGGSISIQHLNIDAGANVDVNAGGGLVSPGNITNNSDNVVIDGDVTDSGNFTNNGAITGSGNLNLGAGSALGGTGSINGTDMGDITYSPGDDLDLSQPLPITLLSFDARWMDDRVVLSWSTASETNNDFFTIERSGDILNWKIVGEVAGAGNATEVRNYSFQDSDPVAGYWYYRLKQTDYDGSYEYFDAVEVFVNRGFSGSRIFQADSFVEVRHMANTTWQIIDLQGHIKRQGVTDAMDQYRLPINDLITGVYLFRIDQMAHKIVIR